MSPHQILTGTRDTVYPAEPESGIQVLSIKYAGDLITDSDVLRRFHKAIRKNAEIEINDCTLDFTPNNPYATTFFPRREFVIEYRDSRHSGIPYLKRRSQLGEHGLTIDFSWDIFEASWGDIPGYNKYALTASPGVMQSLFDALDKDTWMLATCENISFDPAPGRLKCLQITYGCHGGPVHKVAVPERQIFKARHRWDRKFINKRASFVAPQMMKTERPIAERPKASRRTSWRSSQTVQLKTA